jgi:hypothetical protein
MVIKALAADLVLGHEILLQLLVVGCLRTPCCPSAAVSSTAAVTMAVVDPLAISAIP